MKIYDDYDIVNKFSNIPIRLFKFTEYQVITTGKHANKFLDSKCLRSIDLSHDKYLEEINFDQKTILLVREPKERLISGLCQEWVDLGFYETLQFVNRETDLKIQSKSFNHFIALTLLDTNLRYDATHVAPWLYKAVKIKQTGKDMVSVFNFSELDKLFTLLNITDTSKLDIEKLHMPVDHRKLSCHFPNSIHKALDYYCRHEYTHYKFLLERS